MLAIPNLRETPFDGIEAELSMPQGEFADDEFAGGMPWEIALRGRIDGDGPVSVSVEVSADPVEGGLRAALTLSLQSKAFQLLPLPKPRWKEEWEPCELETLWSPLNVFMHRSVDLLVGCSFSLERTRIPAQSLVASMIGLRTMAGDEQYLLAGAQFAVRGFPDDTISWYLTPGVAGQEVSGQVVRREQGTFRPDSLADAVYVAQSRFNRMVLAQSDVKVHATS
jgi:hypothetical protein